MSTPSLPENHGLVRPWERGRSFRLERVAPGAAVERIVDRHWLVQWDLRGRQPFTQETLPHPSVNLVVEPDGAWVWGVPTRRDTRLLRGQGWAVGTKFRPGAFTACTGIEASSITDGRISVQVAFGAALKRRDTPAGEPSAIIAAVEALLAPRADVDDPSLDLVNDVIDDMRSVAPNARVEDLAARRHVSTRTLQRVFRRYVGVSPKWVLKRLRIQHAAERLAAATPEPWTDLALDLGYYDHAHFIRDFRLIVGRSPADYAAEAKAARRP
jgi:AraC-like DNA-binding protein